MSARRLLPTLAGGLAIGAGLAALGYAGLLAYHRARYGTFAGSGDDSLLLDRFIPAPEVVEHHRVKITAPAETVLSTARSLELFNSRLVRTIIKMRKEDTDERKEHEAILETYLHALGMLN